MDYLKSLIDVLPHKPGVYQYFDENEKILYVGKAKNLKKRVSSYFTKSHDSNKTKVLVKRIANIRHIVVDREEDALLLENNLIKKYQPRYNVMLKDDKSFPWICIKKERYPRVFMTRKLIRDGSEYYGPYTSVRMVKLVLDLIRHLYPLRNCNLNLSQENIDNLKFKECLEFHLENCKAPCIGKQKVEEYDNNINEIRTILKGNLQSVKSYLSDLMNKYAKDYAYEEAQQIKEKIEIIDQYQSKSTIVNPKINNIDVYSIIDDEKSAYINFIKVVNGAIIQAHTIEIKKKLSETVKELLPIAIIDIRQKVNSNSKEIVIPFSIDYGFSNVKFTIPQRGDKKQLLELSERNAKYYRFEKMKYIEKANPQKKVNRIMETMKKDLHLKEKPVHIEGFDNSNIQGTNPVAACVVFKNGKPQKSEYRKFNIKTVVGANDFASMEEIIFRRYNRLLNEKKTLPQLIVIDGGKGQLSAAVNSLNKLKLMGKIAIIGIAKKLEEIYFPGDSIPLYLDKNSETLKVIQHIRNESHRFGITFHRNKRQKSAIKSELENISGIGEKTIQVLLKKFKSIKNIREANMEELVRHIGKSKANLIKKYFQH
ncbi:MAG: excinuclease ABC subunit UvrC [Chlorobi bacterium]|nr:excinuclease ABC subunit UvrC [Chlorobiota bacterium]